MTLTVGLGFLPDERAVVARLYWTAFGAKLGRVLGPAPRAERFLIRVLQPDHAIAARRDGVLLGVAGFKTAAGALVGGGLADLAAVYGWAGALWRAVLLGLLERKVQTGQLLMDGICVAEAARGQGVGTRLLEAVCAEAARRGCREVRLDVIDRNPRARALYERLGFTTTATQRMGPLAPIFGFSEATTMIKRV